MSIRTWGFVVAVLFSVLAFVPNGVSADTATTTQDNVEAVVRAYFKNNPVMIEIARCESKFKQHNADGTVLHGGWGGQMIGVFQFYGKVHQTAASALGFDISTLKGNLGYAQHVHAMSGTTPWNSSKTCWSNAVAAVSKFKTSNQDLAVLQKRVKTLTKLLAELRKLLEEKKTLASR